MLMTMILLDDVFAKFADQIDTEKLMIVCLGGGRICVDPAARKISVYGSSQVSEGRGERGERGDRSVPLGLWTSRSSENSGDSSKEISSMDSANQW